MRGNFHETASQLQKMGDGSYLSSQWTEVHVWICQDRNPWTEAASEVRHSAQLLVCLAEAIHFPVPEDR